MFKAEKLRKHVFLYYLLARGTPANARSRGLRVWSLDAFRGATIAGMVLVNNPGDPEHVYSQLAHVEWHGLTFADIIAPCFLWIIGVTMALSLPRRRVLVPSSSVLQHVVVRAASLYVIGILITILPAMLPGSPTPVLENLKVMHVLQRIAVCYALGCAVYLFAGPRSRGVIAMLLLAGYWVILGYYPGPVEGTGAFDPVGNRAYVFDKQVLGDWGDATTHALLTIPGVLATILFGSIVGDTIRTAATHERKVLFLVAGGAVMCIGGMLISHWVPLNRRLWTPSFAFVTAGLAMLGFGGIYWLFDVQRIRRSTLWLVALGASPIFFFIISELGRILAGTKGMTGSDGVWQSYWELGDHFLLRFANPEVASALFACLYLMVLAMVAVGMYRKGWIFKL